MQPYSQFWAVLLPEPPEQEESGRGVRCGSFPDKPQSFAALCSAGARVTKQTREFGCSFGTREAGAALLVLAGLVMSALASRAPFSQPSQLHTG